jgi:acetate---CoA ligase (ADP-forming)
MSLDPLLSPRSIAVVGASDNPKRIGGVPVDLLKRAGFERLYPVNPKNETVQGLTAYKDIESVPEVVDLVVVALSAEATLPYLERCHALGIPAALVFASGYAETNEPEGLARQEALTTFVQRTGMKVAGPNAMGNVNFSKGLFTTFGQSFQPGEPAGNTALVTQSGNMCATVFRIAKRAGVTFSQVINTGNEASVELSDYLDHLADDPSTTSALCYIEELRNGPKFLAAAEKFRKAAKLLAVYKVGASEKGAEATRSHTAALAGDSAAYDAAFARAGVARASELSVLADLAYLHTLEGKIAPGEACRTY